MKKSHRGRDLLLYVLIGLALVAGLVAMADAGVSTSQSAAVLATVLGLGVPAAMHRRWWRTGRYWLMLLGVAVASACACAFVVRYGPERGDAYFYAGIAVGSWGIGDGFGRPAAWPVEGSGINTGTVSMTNGSFGLFACNAR